MVDGDVGDGDGDVGPDLDGDGGDDGDDDDVDGDGGDDGDGDVRPHLSTSSTTAPHLEAFELPSKLNLDILLKTEIFRQSFFSQ